MIPVDVVLNQQPAVVLAEPLPPAVRADRRLAVPRPRVIPAGSQIDLAAVIRRKRHNLPEKRVPARAEKAEPRRHIAVFQRFLPRFWQIAVSQIAHIVQQLDLRIALGKMDHAVRVHPRAVIRRQPETADKLFPVLHRALRLVRHRRVPCVGDRPQAAVPVRRRNRDGFPIRFQPPASALRHALRRHKPIRPAEFAVKVNLHHSPLLLLKQDEGKRPPRRLDFGIILNHRARIFPIDGLRPLVVQPKAAVVGQRASRRQQKCRQYDSPSFHVLPPSRAKKRRVPFCL